MKLETTFALKLLSKLNLMLRSVRHRSVLTVSHSTMCVVSLKKKLRSIISTRTFKFKISIDMATTKTVKTSVSRTKLKKCRASDKAIKNLPLVGFGAIIIVTPSIESKILS